MRLSAGIAANFFAWIVLIGLIAVAFVMVEILGPFGLVLLGLLTLFICTQYDLNDDVPAWGTEVFRARMARRGSPEQRAALREEKRENMSPLRFYRWCGVVLLVAGVAGFVWQQLPS
jgi:uncharacterized membrane protein YdcZ (DUF606 family)